MALNTLENLIEQTIELTADEKLQLAAHLLEQARRDFAGSRPRRRWAEIAGAAFSSYPLFGEDAQEWVSRTRQESDQKRKHSMGQDL